MKIYHTADWHLGKIVNGFSMLEDQKYILKQLINNLQSNKIDILIISGDIYDRSIPSQDAIKLLDDTLFEIISKLGIKILIIPGNHDSSQRLSFANKLYSSNGLFIVGEIKKKITKITISDSYGPINFYLLPYFLPAQINKIYHSNQSNEEFKIKTFNEAFQAIIKYNKPFIDLSSRNILVTHGFFGLLDSKNKLFYDQITRPSELSVGGADIIDISPAIFFDYIALGHIHSPQIVKYPQIRYSGSLLKYSIDESRQQKSNVILEIKEKGNLSIKFDTLNPIRDIKIITGYLKDLCCDQNKSIAISEDYIFVELLDQDPIYDVIPRLKQIFNNLMGVKMINRFNIYNIETNKNISFLDHKNKDFDSVFSEFYSLMSGQTLNLQKQNIISDILQQINNSNQIIT